MLKLEMLINLTPIYTSQSTPIKQCCCIKYLIVVIILIVLHQMRIGHVLKPYYFTGVILMLNGF